MDIVYRISDKKVLLVYNTSGELSVTGSIIYDKVVLDCKEKKIDLLDFKIWSWIPKEEFSLFPEDFAFNYDGFFVVEDSDLGIPIGITKNNNDIIVRKIEAGESIPIVWNGMIFNSISYSLINRKMILGLKERGFDIYVCAMRANDRSEVPKEELKELEKLGCYSLHLEKTKAIKVYCYLPVSRTPPSLYNIYYTMMESTTINPDLISTLNAYNNECWFPCISENSYIQTQNKYLKKVSKIKKQDKLLTHGNTYNNIKVISKRLYSGNTYKLSTYLNKDIIECTENHPFMVFENNSLVEKKIKDIKLNDKLFYLRQLGSKKFNYMYLHDIYNQNFISEKSNVQDGKIYFYRKKIFYNHLIDTESLYDRMLDGSGTINNGIKIDDNLVRILSARLFFYDKENNTIVFKNSEASSLIKNSINDIFGLNVDITSYYNSEIINISEAFVELLDTMTGCILKDDNSFDIFNSFGLNEKAVFIRFLFKYYNIDINKSRIRARFYDELSVMYLVGFLLDIGIVPKIERESKKDNSYECSLVFYDEQKNNLERLINNDEVIYIEESKGDLFDINKDSIYFNLTEKKKEVKELDVYNFEVSNFNTYQANFLMNHNCNFNIDTFKDGGLKTNIQYMPLAYDDVKFNPEVKELDFGKMNFELVNNNASEYPSLPSGFVFLSVFRYSYRKGPDVLIKAFKEAFKKGDNVSLVIFSRHYLGNIKTSEIDTISAVREDLKKWLGDTSDCAPIYWSNDFLSDEDMPGLFKNADCFISTSRGECACLPVLEAGGMKIPVIAPENTVFSDYMNNDHGYVIETDGYENCGSVELIDGKLTYIGENPEWTVWITNGFKNQMFPILGEKAVTQTAKHMMDVYTNYSKAKEKAEKFYSYLKDNYTWKKTLDRISDRLNEVISNIRKSK